MGKIQGVSFGELVGPSENSPWAFLGKQNWRWPPSSLSPLALSSRVSAEKTSVCGFKTSPCVPAPRPHVVTHVRVVPVHTGTFWIYTRRFFLRAKPRHTPHHTHTTHTTPHTQPTPQHSTTRRQRHRDRERQRETERDRERETRHHKKTEDETIKENKRGDERRDQRRRREDQRWKKRPEKKKRRSEMKEETIWRRREDQRWKKRPDEEEETGQKMKDKTREDQRGEKKQDKRRDKMKREREREMEERWFFFKKNVWGPSNPPDELAQHVSKKKNPFRRIIPPFFCKSAESGRFFIYLHDSNSIFLGPGN